VHALHSTVQNSWWQSTENAQNETTLHICGGN